MTDREEWKRLAEAASAAPWGASWDYKRLSVDSEFVSAHGVGPQIISQGVSIDGSHHYQPSAAASAQMQADAAFIAAARTAVPVLLEAEAQALARAEKAEGENVRLRAEVEIVASVPVPESTEKNTLGWLKARARAALKEPSDE